MRTGSATRPRRTRRTTSRGCGSRKPASRSRSTRPGTCSAMHGSDRRRSGPGHTSTRFPRAASSTARSASSPRSRRSSGRAAGTVAVFRDEERGCAGSRAPGRARRAAGRVPRDAHRARPAAAAADAPLGIVTGIVGVSRGSIVVDGHAGHAGTTPMDARDDALVKAAERMLAMRDVARSIDGAVATVGRARGRARRGERDPRARDDVGRRAGGNRRVAACGWSRSSASSRPTGRCRRRWTRGCRACCARRSRPAAFRPSS